MSPTRRPAPEPLISASAIAERVEEIAAEIDRDYADAEEILMLGVLRGAYIFLADLSRALEIPRRIDFIALSSYERASNIGGVRLIMDARVSLAGQDLESLTGGAPGIQQEQRTGVSGLEPRGLEIQIEPRLLGAG